MNQAWVAASLPVLEKDLLEPRPPGQISEGRAWLSPWARRLWVPPRIQAFEFCDQAWLKGCWREAYLDGLNFLFQVLGLHRRMVFPFARWARAAGHARVLDLASGGGGHVATLLASARRHGVAAPRVILSDLYPDTTAFRRLQEAFAGQVEFVDAPVDATAPRPGAAGAAPLWSICTGFHHFAPEQARSLLLQATTQADGLYIQEVFRRSLLSPLLSLPSVCMLMLAPFFAPRLSWRKVLITTLLPLVPLMIVCDGTISALRTYRHEEILALLPAEAKARWRWERGSLGYLGLFRAPYLFGYRVREGEAA